MTRYLGTLTRLVVFTLVIIVQLGLLQANATQAHPWINLPLILLLWNAVHRLHPWPLIAAGIVGALFDLTSSTSFGIFTLAHVLATLVVMVISVEWLARRGTSNRVVIAMSGLVFYGLTWWVADRGATSPAHFFSLDLLWEIILLLLAFNLFKVLRPLWVGLSKPVKRYA